MENLIENDYIDFDKLFKDLSEDQKDSLIEYKYEVERCNHILLFLDNMEGFGLDKEECLYSDNELHFSFSKVYKDANESNPNNSYEKVFIIFDRSLNEFSSYEFEQG